MTSLWKIVAAFLASVILALLGAYVLWQFHTLAGLLIGVGCVLLAVAIALPIPFHAGIVAVKENAVLIVPVVQDAIKGGKRKTDPPADPDAPGGGA